MPADVHPPERLSQLGPTLSATGPSSIKLSYTANGLHCSSVLGLPFRILNIELVKPKKVTTMETIGAVAKNCSVWDEPLAASQCPARLLRQSSTVRSLQGRCSAGSVVCGSAPLGFER